MNKKYVFSIGLAVFTMAASAQDLAIEGKQPTTDDPVKISLDCHAYDQRSWLAIYKKGDKLSRYGNSRKDWFYMNQGKDCVFAMRPRKTAGEYVVRLFKDNNMEILAELPVTVVKGTGKPKQVKTVKKPKIENKNFWVALPASQFAAKKPIQAQVNCHNISYGGQDLLLKIVKPGETETGRPAGKFQKDWFYLKNNKKGEKCTLDFAPRDATGKYELRVISLDDPTIRASIPFSVGADQRGSMTKKPFSIARAKDTRKKWDPVRGNNNCANMVGANEIENRCGKPIEVTLLELANGTGYKPHSPIKLAPKAKTAMGFTPKLTIGWFACFESDEKCKAVHACLGKLKQSWKSHYSTDNEVRCNFAGKYKPL